MSNKFLPIQIFIMTVLSSVAAYTVPDLSQSNWDTVLFLTPYGLINNFLNRKSTVMWSFYSDISAGQLELSQNQVLLMAVVYTLLLTHVIYFLRYKTK